MKKVIMIVVLACVFIGCAKKDSTIFNSVDRNIVEVAKSKFDKDTTLTSVIVKSDSENFDYIVNKDLAITNKYSNMGNSDMLIVAIGFLLFGFVVGCLVRQTNE